jgi:hypothetical protein
MYTKRLFFSAMALAAMLQPGLASQPVKELTPQEKETAHKLWLLQQALPQKDITHGQVGPHLHELSNPGPLVDTSYSSDITQPGMRGKLTKTVGGGIVTLANSIPPNMSVKIHADANILNGKGPLQKDDLVSFDQVKNIGMMWFITGDIKVLNR